jgi:hypothetical protein
MSTFDRRQFLKGVLGKMAVAAGTVVVASAAAPVAQGRGDRPGETNSGGKDVEERADRLVATGHFPNEEMAAAEFLNGGFRNTPLGGFGNGPLGGFRNTPLGGFRNTPLGGFGNGPLGGFRNSPVAGFRNAPLGGFRNTPIGPFANGGWPNGGWGAFRNGGWPNHGWGNWW